MKNRNITIFAAAAVAATLCAAPAVIAQENTGGEVDDPRARADVAESAEMQGALKPAKRGTLIFANIAGHVTATLPNGETIVVAERQSIPLDSIITFAPGTSVILVAGVGEIYSIHIGPMPVGPVVVEVEESAKQSPKQVVAGGGVLGGVGAGAPAGIVWLPSSGQLPSGTGIVVVALGRPEGVSPGAGIFAGGVPGGVTEEMQAELLRRGVPRQAPSERQVTGRRVSPSGS